VYPENPTLSSFGITKMKMRLPFSIYKPSKTPFFELFSRKKVRKNKNFFGGTNIHEKPIC
jgi:hypothetical protein